MTINQTSNFQKNTSKNPLQKFLLNNFYSSLISFANKLEPNSILDVGCGEGFTLNKLHNEHFCDKLEGIDNSDEAIKIGKKLFPDIKLNKADIYKLPYNKDSFDLVISTEVLEHLENPEKALSEILRVAKKYVLLSVPNEPFFMLSNFLRGKNFKAFGNDPGHINHWTVFSFIKFLKAKKIEVKKMKLPFPWILVLIEK